jgi:hypothetical protein
MMAAGKSASFDVECIVFLYRIFHDCKLYYTAVSFFTMAKALSLLLTIFWS